MSATRRALDALWRTAVSPVTFVVLALFWCLDLAIGSFLVHGSPGFFGSMDAVPFSLWLEKYAPEGMPGSLWVYVLVILTWVMVASLVLCTVNWFLRRRGAFRAMGEVLVHLGFLLIFTGYVVGSSLGVRSQGITVPLGQTAKATGFNFDLRLDGLELERFPDGQARDILSRLTLVRDGVELASGTIRTNHPLIYGPVVVYPPEVKPQMVGGRMVTVGVYNVHSDPGIWLVIAGAAILALGTFWSLGRYLGAIPLPPGR